MDLDLLVLKKRTPSYDFELVSERNIETWLDSMVIELSKDKIVSVINKDRGLRSKRTQLS